MESWRIIREGTESINKPTFVSFHMRGYIGSSTYKEVYTIFSMKTASYCFGEKANRSHSPANLG